ncbi:MAG: hypothetical protein ACM3YM_04190 [Sphingomonadales bacterium]
MRIFFIILILVAVLFAAVVVYGVRHKEAAGGTAGGGAPQASGGKLDEDDLEGWEPPKLGPLATLSRKFAPRLKLEPARVQLAANGTEELRVPSSKKKQPRVARITLEAGRLVLVTARHDGGEDDDVTCLCQPGDLPAAIGTFRGCPAKWVVKQLARCDEDAGRAMFSFGPEGGAIVLQAPSPATVATR